MIFDVDGTLVDSNDAHALAFVDALRSLGYKIAFKEVRPLIGTGSDKLIPQLIGGYQEAVAERKKAIFMDRYLPRVRPFDGVRLLVRTLKAIGLKLAVASSAAKDELDALLRLTGAAECFEQHTDAEDAGRSKPDPDIVRVALRKLGLPTTGCVMVGDTPYDAAAARGAQVAFIGLRCGGWGDRDLQPAVSVYRDPADLLANVDSWTRV